jgi:hypothetical protein
MAGLGNLNMSDMKWIGEPLDVVGQYQKGVNLAEQGQRMQQSADMHPLKMDDAKARTNLVKQQGEYNTRTMDDRVGLAGSMAGLQETARKIAENTQGEEQDRLKAISQQQVTNAWIGKATSNLRAAALNASSEGAVLNQAKKLANQEYAIEAERAGMELEVNKATLYEQEMGNKRSLMKQRVALGQQQADLATHENVRWKAEKGLRDAEWARIAAMTNVERMNYKPNPHITSTTHQRELAQFATSQKSGEQWADFRKAQDNLNSADAEQGIKITKAKGEMNAQTFGILSLSHPVTGKKYFENEDGTLNQPGWVMLDKLTASDAVWKRLNPANKQKISAALHALGPSPTPHQKGATVTGQYGSDYNGQIVLDEKGIGYASEMLEGQKRAARASDHMWKNSFNVGVKTIDAEGNWIYADKMSLKADQIANVKDLVLAKRKEYSDAQELNGESPVISAAKGRQIAVEAATEAGIMAMPAYLDLKDALGDGALPNSTFLNIKTGIVSTIPKTTGAGGTTVPGQIPQQKSPQRLAPDTTGQTGDEDDVMLGVGGYTTAKFNDMMNSPNIGDAEIWEKRGEVFGKVYDKLKTVPHKLKPYKASGGKLITSDVRQRRLARYMTKMAIESQYKTGSVLQYMFRDDYDVDSKTSRLFKQVSQDFKVNKAEAREELTELIFGTSYGLNDSEQISWDNVAKLRAAIKGDPKGWYKKFNIKENPTGPDFLGGKIKSEVTADNHKKIEMHMRSLDEYGQYIFALDAVKFGPNK